MRLPGCATGESCAARWAHGDPVADGRTLELRERILAFAVAVEPELFLVVMLLSDQRATSHRRARDAAHERVEEALDFPGRRWRNAMKARATTLEGVRDRVSSGQKSKGGGRTDKHAPMAPA
jgi:hypothetical protein